MLPVASALKAESGTARLHADVEAAGDFGASTYNRLHDHGVLKNGEKI